MQDLQPCMQAKITPAELLQTRIAPAEPLRAGWQTASALGAVEYRTVSLRQFLQIRLEQQKTLEIRHSYETLLKGAS